MVLDGFLALLSHVSTRSQTEYRHRGAITGLGAVPSFIHTSPIPPESQSGAAYHSFSRHGLKIEHFVAS
jgi:hypothetical protein